LAQRVNTTTNKKSQVKNELEVFIADYEKELPFSQLAWLKAKHLHSLLNDQILTSRSGYT